jgi:hypothetical protein
VADLDMPIVLPVFILLLLWAALGQLFGLLYPFVGRLIVTMSPQSRSQFLPVYSMLPVVIAATIALLVFTPLVGGVNFSGHCHGLDCSDHVPMLQATPFISKGIILIFALSLLLTVLFLAFSIWRNYRTADVLYRLSRKEPGANFRTLETGDMVACCVGLFRSDILISRGILEKTSPLQLQIILSHELAHACRFDNLRKFIVATVTPGWPRHVRKQLLADVELACEQGCDRAVAALIGSAQAVAETLHLINAWQGSTISQMDREQIRYRIALLGGPDELNEPTWKPVAMVLSSSAALTVVAGDILHQAAEVILTVIPWI